MWSLTGFVITAFASGSDQLPLASDCLGNGDQRMVLNRDATPVLGREPAGLPSTEADA